MSHNGFGAVKDGASIDGSPMREGSGTAGRGDVINQYPLYKKITLAL